MSPHSGGAGVGRGLLRAGWVGRGPGPLGAGCGSIGSLMGWQVTSGLGGDHWELGGFVEDHREPGGFAGNHRELGGLGRDHGNCVG